MKLYRAAKKGIDKMIGGSFYTEDYSIAESYSELEENAIVYEFDVTVKLFDVDGLFDLDLGINEMMEEVENCDEIFNNYDGIYSQDGLQIILFGSILKGEFTKQSIDELLKDVNAETRRYDR
ncbi:MAG: hypothetical protein QNK20_01065 [Aureibaculum sp.]|nr:hypothetical protein [Aureibaculum sp.]